MKNMWYPVQITGLKEKDNKLIVQGTTTATREEVERYVTKDGIQAVIQFVDGRSITHEQRKKLYAMFADIADYTGDIPEYVKEYQKHVFCGMTGIEYFSLSDCNIETARAFINSVIEFVIANDIPMTELGIERTDDISKYLYYAIKHKKCCICGKLGNVYTLDKDNNKMCLCTDHHDMAKVKGLNVFCDTYKIYGIQFVL